MLCCSCISHGVRPVGHAGTEPWAHGVPAHAYLFLPGNHIYTFPLSTPAGVWSGCAFPTEQGTVILNTAVKLRANSTPEELPPAHLDLGLQMVESQAFALAQPSEWWPELG